MIRRGVIFGALALVLAMTIAAAALASSASEEGPRLAYIRLSLKPWSIQILSSDSAGRAALPIVGGGRGAKSHPIPLTSISWSRDGSQIAFVGGTGEAANSFGAEKQAIFLAPAGGGSAREVPRSVGGTSPLFSPDGSTIAYVRFRGGDSSFVTSGGKHGRTYARSSIWLTSLDGKRARQLTPWRAHAHAWPSSFSPDSSRLAITEYRNDGSVRAVALLLSSSGQELIAKEAHSPVYSPDGSRIALIRRQASAQADIPDTTDLYVVDPDGTDLVRLTQTRATEAFPSWDPSGQRLAYVRLSTSPTANALFGFGDAIMEVNADGSCITKILTRRNTAFYDPVWQPGRGREAGPISC